MEQTTGAGSVKRVQWAGAVLALLAVLAAVFCGHASAQVEQEWAARYNGPGNSTDGATAMAVDAAGNVYVTGASVGLDASADYATVKYDASGNELWAARYSGPGNTTDRAAAMAVDADGNVYVTGNSDGSDPPIDFLTVKYDADGNELWVARYNNSAGKPMGRAGFIAVDGSGNVYVSGISFGAYGYPSGYAMVKYDGSGNELWVARLEHFISGRSAVALDAAGNVYVTGTTPGMGTSATTCATFKYDGSGNEVWRAGCGCGYHSGGTGLALDASGDVYVTAFCQYTGTIPEGYATVKYDSSGNELWRARYESPDPGFAVPALDAAGDVYVTGVGDGGATSGGYATIKYDAGGDELWAARYSGPDSGAAAIALDASGNVYVTGASGGDYATIKMVPTGITAGGGDGSGGGGGCFITAATN